MTKKTNPDIQAAIDTRLVDAVAAANYRITLNNQKQNARLKLQKDLTYSVNGGIFSITPELISFVAALITMGKDETVLLDVNKNPIEIADLEEFQDTIVGIYHECTNQFLVDFKAINKQRTAKALVGAQ